MPVHDVALFTTLPDEYGVGYVEASGPGYSRQPAQFAESDGTSSNIADIEFGRARAPWGAIVGFGLFDGAELVRFGPLTSEVETRAGYLYRFLAGSISYPSRFPSAVADEGVFDEVIFDYRPTLDIAAVELLEVGMPPRPDSRLMHWSKR